MLHDEALVTLSYPYSGTVEAHALGCKAAGRKVQRVATDQTTISAGSLRAILANPDEGDIKIHACLRGEL